MRSTSDHSQDPALFELFAGDNAGNNVAAAAPELAGRSPRETAGKKLLRKLLEIRLALDATQKQEFGADLQACIEAVRAKIRLTDGQRIEAILYSIEHQGAATRVEIAEDTRLDQTIVKTIVEGLLADGTLFETARHVPGSDRQYYILKSIRQNVPIVTTQIIPSSENHYDQIADRMAA